MVVLDRMLHESPSQTAGPYVHIGCTPNFIGIKGSFGGHDLGECLISDGTPGRRIRITGCIFDGLRTPIKDGIVEVWQADHLGLFNSPVERRGKSASGFVGWGRRATDPSSGEFSFSTIKPGPTPFVDARMQAPFISFWIAARGINLGLHTRMYFPDEIEANRQDPVLTRLEHSSRISTLLANEVSENEYRFDIVLQGEDETVFFDV